MLIVEVDVFEVFLVTSDLFANNQLLEIDEAVLHLVLLLLHALNFILEVTNVPGHLWVLHDDFAQ